MTVRSFRRIAIAVSFAISCGWLAADDRVRALGPPLQSPDAKVQQAALQEVALQAKTRRISRLRSLRSSRRRIRTRGYYAAKALQKIGDCSSPILEALIAAGGNKSRDVRKAIIDAIAPCGATVHIAIAVPTLGAALKDSDRVVPSAAIKALEKLGPVALSEWKNLLAVARKDAGAALGRARCDRRDDRQRLVVFQERKSARRPEVHRDSERSIKSQRPAR